MWRVEPEFPFLLPRSSSMWFQAFMHWPPGESPVGEAVGMVAVHPGQAGPCVAWDCSALSSSLESSKEEPAPDSSGLRYPLSTLAMA